MRALAAGVWVTMLSSLALGGAAVAQTLPNVSPPQVNPPAVPVPSLPKPPVTLPEAPKLPATPPSGGAPGGTPGGVPALPAPGRGGSGGGSGSGSGATGSGGGGSRSGAAAGSSGSSSSGGAERREKAEHRFRRSVKRLRGCFGAITPFERRVLRLRAGLFGQPRSRTATARRLHTSSSRVARAERRSVRRLRQAAHTGGCGGGLTVGNAITSGLLVAAAARQGGDARVGGKLADRDLQEVLGVSLSSDKSGAGQPALGTAGLAVDKGADSDGRGPVALYWALALLLLAVSTVMILRRRRFARTGPAAGGAPAAVDEPAAVEEPAAGGKPAADEPPGERDPRLSPAPWAGDGDAGRPRSN